MRYADKQLIYHILLIIRGEKLSCFLQITLQLQKSCGKFLHANAMNACNSW